jgi:hypothetical protein
MKKSILSGVTFALLAVFTNTRLAAEDHTKLTGYIVERDCGQRLAKAGLPPEMIAREVKNCVLTTNASANADFGLLVDNTFYEFDKTGKKLARAAVAQAGALEQAKFTVVGRVSTDTVTRATIPGPNGSAIPVTGHKGKKIYVESVTEGR